MRKGVRKICPNCRKPRLAPFIGFHTGSYECKNCGYIGPIAVEEVRNKKRPSFRQK